MRMKLIGLTVFCVSAFAYIDVSAHCQMPCGIYHDDMVFDEIDQYVETMYKGISVLNNNPFANSKDRNEFTRWVIEKEKASDNVAKWIMQYFLQQKIKPGEADTPRMLASAHSLLFLLVGIKQNSSLDYVEQFSKEWDKFKLMFHRQGYECEMEKIKLKKDEEARMKNSESQK
jgi:nickel superoxide dismutase